MSMLRRATSPTLDARWLERCEGFRVDDGNGRLGTVSRVGIDADSGAPAWLVVRTGLFVRRDVVVGVDDVESVDPVGRRIIALTRLPVGASG
jgi:PRC-barrel domain